MTSSSHRRATKLDRVLEGSLVELYPSTVQVVEVTRSDQQIALTVAGLRHLPEAEPLFAAFQTSIAHPMGLCELLLGNRQHTLTTSFRETVRRYPGQ